MTKTDFLIDQVNRCQNSKYIRNNSERNLLTERQVSVFELRLYHDEKSLYAANK